MTAPSGRAPDMARQFAEDELYRVVATGQQPVMEWDRDAWKWKPTGEHRDVKRTLGPYPQLGTAKAQRNRAARGLVNAEVVVEGAKIVWEAVE